MSLTPKPRLYFPSHQDGLPHCLEIFRQSKPHRKPPNTPFWDRSCFVHAWLAPSLEAHRGQKAPRTSPGTQWGLLLATSRGSERHGIQSTPSTLPSPAHGQGGFRTRTTQVSRLRHQTDTHRRGFPGRLRRNSLISGSLHVKGESFLPQNCQMGSMWQKRMMGGHDSLKCWLGLKPRKLLWEQWKETGLSEADHTPEDGGSPSLYRWGL